VPEGRLVSPRRATIMGSGSIPIKESKHMLGSRCLRRPRREIKDSDLPPQMLDRRKEEETSETAKFSLGLGPRYIIKVGHCCHQGEN